MNKKAYNKKWRAEHKSYDKEYYKKNIERLRKYHYEWKQKNREKVSSRQAEWYQENKKRVRDRKRAFHKLNSEAINARQRKWRRENKNKIQAHRIVRKLLINKLLIKLPCRDCQSFKVEAHHEDYTKPEEVIWLCKMHHLIADRIRRKKELQNEIIFNGK